MFETLGRKYAAGYILSISANKDPFILQHKEMENYYKIIYLKSGVFNFTLNNKDFILTGAHVLCINEKDKIEFIQTPESIRILLFKPDVINSSFNFELINGPGDTLPTSGYQDLYYLNIFCHDAPSNKKILSLSGYNSKSLSEKMEEIALLTGEQDDGCWPCKCRACLMEILFSLIRQGENENSGLLPAFSGGSKLVADIIYYLQSSYSQKISIDILSSRFHTNRTTLTSSFKSYTGQSISKYLMQLRLTMASALLRDTELSIDEICERTGFSDIGYFSKVFKKNIQYKPSEYRRIHANE